MHAFPGIRQGVLARRLPPAFPAAVRCYATRPTGHRKILARGSAIGKALLIGLLSSGFAGAARAREGFAVNASFAGASSFDRGKPYAKELAAARVTTPSERHLIMCHPGHPDAALAKTRPR